MTTNTEILKFYATWCGPCKMVAPVLDKLSDETGIPVVAVDIDAESEKARDYNVMSVPTIIKLVDGEEVARLTGAKPLTVLRRELSL